MIHKRCVNGGQLLNVQTEPVAKSALLRILSVQIHDCHCVIVRLVLPAVPDYSILEWQMLVDSIVYRMLSVKVECRSLYRPFINVLTRLCYVCTY